MNMQATTDARLAALTEPQRRALLQRIAARSTVQIQPREETSAPLTFAQRNLWFMNEVEADQYKYNMVSAYAIQGPLNVPALQQALDHIVARHRVLASRFATADGEPHQDVLPQRQGWLSVIDLEMADGESPHVQLERLIREEARHLFDLQRGPLFRAHLYRLAAHEHVLQLNIHHAIFDGWSKGLLFGELKEAYGAYCERRVPQLPSLRVQFSDFAAWQRTNLSTAVDADIEYWRTALTDAPPLVYLPADYPRPPVMNSDAQTVALRIEPAQWAALQACARTAGASAFMSTLAAFKVLLQRCTHQNDFSIGTPVDNRSRPELHKLIGYFLNTVIIRTWLSPRSSFRDAVAAVRSATLSAFQHQDAPFEEVVRVVNPVRSQSFTPLTQVMFVFQHHGVSELSLAGTEIEKIAAGNETTKYDLYASFREVDGGLNGWLSFRTDLFRRSTIEALAAAFVQLVHQLTVRPDAPIESLPLLSDIQRDAILRQGTGAAYPLELGNVADGFTATAQSVPDRIAVYEGGTAVSFEQLEAQATRLASRMRAAGVAIGDRVGIHAKRSSASVAAILAVWKLGAVVVPLDTRQPAERLRKVVETVTPRMVLHDLSSTPEFAQQVRCEPLMAMDASAADAAATTILRVHSLAPAYVLFTSGSTGTPKGVVGTHQGLINRLQWQWREYPAHPDDVIAQRVNAGFVDYFTEVFAALLAGNALVIIDDATLRDPFDTVERLAAHRVTTLYIVPSLLRAILDVYPNLHRSLPSLRRVYSSGEPLTPELVRRMREALPEADLLNVYGATEVTDATVANLRYMQSEGRVSLGLPIDDMRVVVLDAALNLCPTGVAGALYAQGPCVASGYWNDPRLTAERFVPDPYARTPGARMYFFGDQGRRLADGSFEYLGRMDRQVKLRGLRVEIGDIEHAIGSCEGVAAACVVPVPSPAGEEVLVAYVRTEPDAVVDRHRVLGHLRRLLPDYMHPNALVLCEQFPLNTTGKVDREALRARGLPVLQDEQWVLPDSATERRLAAIWQDILHLSQVSVTSSFFELGGHSLLAVRIVSRVREEMGVQIAAQEIFELLTVRALAERIDAMRGHSQPETDQALEVTEL
jgi:amino acid adenylation domain-containing protein